MPAILLYMMSVDLYMDRVCGYVLGYASKYAVRVGVYVMGVSVKASCEVV